MTTQAERLIQRPKPKEPVEYVRLGEIGGELSIYYATVNGETVTVWAWEGQHYGPPEIDREFPISEFEEVVDWLGSKASHEEEADKHLENVGHWTWDGDEVRLYLDCGDERYFELKALRLFARALRAMKPTDGTEAPDLS